MFSKQLVVLVGGRGTRLGAAAKDTPKPLMPITADKVFLDYFLETSVRQGFDDIILLAGHLGEQVYQRYHNQRWGEAHISVLIEPKPMGTGGAFRFAYDQLAPTFLAANGDTLFDINMRAVDHRLHTNPDLLGVLALRHVEDTSRYGQVRLNEAGIIQSFEEKKPSAVPVPGVINGGIYALRKTAIDQLGDGPASIETDLFPQLVKQGRVAGVESHGYFLDIGLPETLQIARDDLPHRKRPVLFLDRDGVINVDKNYLYRIEDFEWIEGIKALIRKANDAGRAVVVVTNQAGVARGYYAEEDVLRLHTHIQATLNAEGAFIDGFYYCPYHEQAVEARYRVANHPDRKPNPGMLLKAARDLNLDLTDGLLIGDNATDIMAAEAAGVRGVLFKGGSLTDLAVAI
jgi:D,D-heptose 1,7-bisphosphate phosphatase